MIKILTDSTYNIIISLFDFKQTDTMIGVGIGLFQESYIDGKETLVYDVENKDFDNDLLAIVLEFPRAFVYTPENGFKLRPSIILEPINENQILKMSKDGSYVFPIRTSIKMRARYVDKDNIGFLNTITKIKMKDRNDFITVPDIFDIDPKNGVHEFEINSDFPGIALLRAKDVNYLCGFDPIAVRFKQL